MNELYLQLGRTIARQCPAGFAEAKLVAAFDGEVPALNIVATMPDGTEYQPGIGGAERGEIESALAEVRASMAEEDDRPWRGCTVTLIAGGGFSLDVNYGPEQQDGVEIVSRQL